MSLGVGLADRYLLGRMLPRMAAALGVTLAALVIERILRLLDFVTGHGADLTPVLSLALNLLPHYMGLALPAAFCIAILTSLATLSKNNELDALESAGWSVRRIGAPFLIMSVIFAMISLLIFGVIQPYSRFAFAEIRHQIANAAWSGRVEQGIFLDLGEATTLSATEIDASGRLLHGVFIVQEGERGRRTVTTARRGLVLPDPARGAVHLMLEDGRALLPEGATVTFDQFRLSREFDLDGAPFRPRGGSERELTLGELWREMNRPGAEDRRFAVEFHSRLVRSISLIGIALLSVPLAVSRKRSSAWKRMALAGVILAVYDNAIKLTSSMAELGRIDPATGLWGLCAVFMLVGLWLYLKTPGQGAASPFRSVYRALSRVAPDPEPPAAVDGRAPGRSAR